MGSPEAKPYFHYETPNEDEWEINDRFGIHIHKEARLGNKCKLGRGVIINKGVILEDDVLVGNNVVIHPDVYIAQGTEILDGTIIYPDTVIGQGSHILENTHLGRPPEIAGTITRQLKSDYGALTIGNHCFIGPYVRLYRGVKIGDNTSIYEFTTVREECKLGRGVVLAPGVTVNYGTVIGNNVRVMHSSHLTGCMVIEDDVFISLHVGSTNDRMIEEIGNQTRQWKGPIIRKGAVIGAGVMLAPEVEIGEGAHIAMLSVVTKDIPPHAFAAGSPARVIPHN